MFHHLYKVLRYLQIKNAVSEDTSPEAADKSLSRNLADNLKTFRDVMGASNDVIIREFAIGLKKQIKAAVIFIEGLADKKTINQSMIKPLMYDFRLVSNEDQKTSYNIDLVKMTLLSVGNLQQISSIGNLVDDCLSGNTIFLLDGSEDALSIEARAWETRGVEEPKTEAIVRGPREGFTETLRTNTSLLRRKIKSPDLTLESMTIGKRTRTAVCLAYIKGLADPLLIEEIKNRLKRIHTDAILESGYIEQFIEDAPYSIFQTLGNSERPDAVAAKLLEGRAAIFVDGTPIVLTAPNLFLENFQSSEDYYSRPYFASLLRMLRFLAYLISILAPATYVIMSSFHQELIPTTLLFSMAAAHEGVPFPSVVEAGIMIVTFEILREAGVRLPRPVGQAVSIVGALVIGESAVNAGLIGAPMVIVVAITAVSSFVVPSQTDSESILRFVFLLLAGVLGGFGILIGLLGLLVHLASLRSFGAPYLSPLAPLTLRDLKDTFIRAPLWTMSNRPRAIARQDSKRQTADLKPGYQDNGK